MPVTYDSIATTTVTTATQANTTFSSISQNYTDLILVIAGTNDPSQNINVRVGNGSVDTGSNYSATYVAGDGSSASSGRFSNQTSALVGAIYTGQSIAIVHFQNYSNTTTYKTMLGRTSSAGNVAAAYVALWRSTSAIDIMTITSTLASGTTFSLYGIKAA